jgi:hypothetical protein
VESYKSEAGPKFGGKKKFNHRSDASLEGRNTEDYLSYDDKLKFDEKSSERLEGGKPEGRNASGEKRRFQKKRRYVKSAKHPWEEGDNDSADKKPKKNKKSKKNKKPRFEGLGAKSRTLDKTGGAPLKRKNLTNSSK